MVMERPFYRTRGGVVGLASSPSIVAGQSLRVCRRSIGVTVRVRSGSRGMDSRDGKGDTAMGARRRAVAGRAGDVVVAVGGVRFPD